MKKSKSIDSCNNSTDHTKPAYRIRNTVSPRDLKRIISKERAYTKWIRQHPVRYPDKNRLRELTLAGVRALGFDSHSLLFLPGPTWPYAELQVKALARAAGIPRRTLPDPQVVKSEVLRSFNAGTSPFLPIDAKGIADGDRGVIYVGAINLQFNNYEKWQYFAETDSEVLRRFHLLAIEETDFAGLKAMATAVGYEYACGQTNSRGQAVGFAVHPRLKILRMFEYRELTDIQGIPDLRSAVRLDLEDSKPSANGIPFAFTAVVVHLKSMLGGAYATAPLRRQQLKKLVKAMGIMNEFVIVLGDFNCFLNRTTDTEPLIENGYKLLNPGNNTSTHEFGGRLDGLFYKNMPLRVKLGSYRVWQFFKNPLIDNSWTDHALLSWKMRVKEAQARLDARR